MRKRHLLNRKIHTHKTTRTNQNRQIITDRTRTITLTPKGDVTTAPTLQTAIIVEATVTLELFDLKQDVTTLTRCMTHCSHAIL